MLQKASVGVGRRDEGHSDLEEAEGTPGKPYLILVDVNLTSLISIGMS